MLPIACLDAGHGGRDPGACGNGLQEKTITLDIVLRIEALILQRGGITPVLTRRTDTDLLPGRDFVPTEDIRARGAISNAARANLMVSVHVNSSSVNLSANWLSAHIWAKGGNAEKAASKILPKLAAVSGWPSHGVETANFMILRGAGDVPGWPSVTDAPAALFENGFISNQANAALLGSPTFRQALAETYANGIYEHFGVVYQKEEEFMPEVVVVYFTPADYSEALIVANEYGGCAMFCRNGGAGVHADAKKAKKIINIGGPELKLPGEVWLSGDRAKDTLKKVAAIL